MSDLKERQLSSVWAHELMHRQTWCLLDTETTGLGTQDEIVQIALLNWDKEVLLNSFVRPRRPISLDASRVHGITDRDVQDAPGFDQVFLKLLSAVGDREIIIYNAAFDMRLISQSLRPYGIYFRPRSEPISIAPGLTQQCIRWFSGAPVTCAMQTYARWVGEPNHWRGGYRWQTLPGGDHTALGDCHALYRLIETMSNPVFLGALDANRN